MAEAHVISALRDKRSELAGTVIRLERELVGHRASLTYLDATMRLFDPDIRPEEIRPRQRRARNAWFRPGECRRLIYDVLRDASQPLPTGELSRDSRLGQRMGMSRSLLKLAKPSRPVEDVMLRRGAVQERP